MIARLVTMTFQEGTTDEFKAVFEAYKGKIRASEGCEYLSLIENVDNPLEISTYSMWKSVDFLNNYRHSETFQEVWPKTKVLFAKKPVAKSFEILTELEG